MTIDEIIVKEQEMSEIFQKTVDTHMVSENLSLEEMYCDDTEIIEEEIKKCKELADFHDQIANIMRKYQKIEDIYERFQKDGGYYHHMARLVDALREVLENGNDD